MNHKKSNGEQDINLIVAKNVRDYIAAIGRSQKWVYERSGIPKTTFYSLLKGEGDINKSIPKLNKLFRIKDPFYFYNVDIQLPPKFEEIEVNAIKNLTAVHFNGIDDGHFQATMNVLADMINIIHILESAKKIG